MIQAPERVVALGDPSYVWRSGQDRRLAFIRRLAPVEERRILDVGCGIGAYVSKLREFSNQVYGVDIEEGRLRRGAQSQPGLALAASEHLPFTDAPSTWCSSMKSSSTSKTMPPPCGRPAG